jgi:glycosyltransferase involved in cell wall biosynthesis
MARTERSVAILGTRGIPASHGGFETFAQHLALHLRRRGWSVLVYCQGQPGSALSTDEWHGIERVHVPARIAGPLGTFDFDIRSTWHALKRRPGVVLTLGYNTALLSLLYRASGITNLINMDGIEWRRSKWTPPLRAWLYLNERLGCWLGDHLIADHPAIAKHLATRVSASKIMMIPYGAAVVSSAPQAPLAGYGLAAGRYALAVARFEPENSVLEIVRAWSKRPRGMKLVVVGRCTPETNEYHLRVAQAAGPEVLLAGAIYEPAVLEALRFHCRLHVHGHRVGGTNPSLVEALGAGNAVLAHDNPFNRWVAGDGARYFMTTADCAAAFDTLTTDHASVAAMGAASRQRHLDAFTWDRILDAYEEMLERWHSTETEPAILRDNARKP